MEKLYFKYGVMSCGKSTKLLQEAYNYEHYNKEIIVAKPIIDKKGDKKIVSRLGVDKEADVLLYSNDLKELYDKITENTICILVDEAQFLNRDQVFELFKITKINNIPVMCYGLKTTFKAEFFEGSKALMEYADVLEELTTICSCGAKAKFNARKINGIFTLDGNDVAIDGFNNVTYESLCGKCYLEKVKKYTLKK